MADNSLKHKKILIIELDNLGDAVMASFLPRVLKQLYPGSYIAVLLKEYTRDVFAHNPQVDELILFNPSWSRD